MYPAAQVEAAKEHRPLPQKKIKSNFVARWLLKTLKDEVIKEQGSANMLVGQGHISVGTPSIDQPERAIQFTVYNATGGRVVETRRYDRHKDRSQTGLYIITSEQDFGKEIDKIITMETLKS
jgi:hypothetical protein